MPPFTSFSASRSFRIFSAGGSGRLRQEGEDLVELREHLGLRGQRLREALRREVLRGGGGRIAPLPREIADLRGELRGQRGLGRRGSGRRGPGRSPGGRRRRVGQVREHAEHDADLALLVRQHGEAAGLRERERRVLVRAEPRDEGAERPRHEERRLGQAADRAARRRHRARRVEPVEEPLGLGHRGGAPLDGLRGGLLLFRQRGGELLGEGPVRVLRGAQPRGPPNAGASPARR